MKRFFTQNKKSLQFIRDIVNQQKKAFWIYTSMIIIIALINTILPYIAKQETDQLVNKATQLRGISFPDSFTTFIAISGVIILIDIIYGLFQNIK